MNKKIFISLTMFLLVINIAYAVVDHPRPVITVTTDEASSVVSYLLIDENANEIDVEYIPVNNMEFKFKPVENLYDGDYSFSVTLKDEFENTNQKTIYFTVELGSLSISLLEPEYGYTSTQTFNLKVLTDREAHCKFDNYGFSFENMQEFDQTSNTEYIIYNYVLDASYKYNINVKCNDSYRNEITSKNFVLHFDDTPPTIIQKYAQPSTVVQYPPQTKLIVKTNEDSVCKYSSDKTNFEEMQDWFSAEEEFSTTHEKDITLPTEPSQATYTYHVKCKNKAGLISTQDDTITVNVNLAAELTIYVNTPPYFLTAAVDLDVSTNKDAQCRYGSEPGNYPYSLSTTDNKRHTKALTLSSGSYTYYILCKAYPEEDTVTISFIVDTTPPNMIYVTEIGYGDVPGKTYKTDLLKGEWKAEDTETNIVTYNILLYLDNGVEPDELIYEGTTTEETQLITGLELNNGSRYYFKVSAVNNIGLWSNNKTGDGITVITLGPAPLTITFIEPKYGVASDYVFDLKLKIEDMIICRYSLDYGQYLTFENMNPLSKTGNNIYYKNSFDEITDTSKHILYIACNNTFGEIEKGSKELGVDTVKPKFTKIQAIPSAVSEEPVETKLIVETDKKTICKYSSTTDDYDSMEGKFSGYDNNDFNLTHEKKLTFSTTTKDYKYYIACMGLNDLQTDITDITITVDLTMPLQITDKTPDYFSEASVDLELYTNKKSQCFYGNSSSSVNKMFDSDKSTSVKNHRQPLLLDPGHYIYYVECIKETEKDTATINFVIDSTSPNMIYVKEIGTEDEPEKTYFKTKLGGEWKAEDNETGINLYNVSLYLDNRYSADELIYQGTTTEEEEWITDLELNDSEKYYFEVSARNAIGLWSSTKKSDGITVDIDLVPPSCNNLEKDSDEAGIDCGGVCSEDCPTNSTCKVNSDCESGFCHNDICKESTCDDNLKGPNEADKDCGGECDEKCDVGKDCGDDDDCKSGNCDISNGECVEAGKCHNNKLDPRETDVDCGGVCLVKCNNGDRCESDYDCKSGNCLDNRCFEPTCSDGMKNQDETDTDCGGSCTPCEDDESCLRDSDCISENCENYVCKAPAEEYKEDTDNDGLSDEWENQYNEGDLDLDLYDTNGDGISDGDEDFDDDGLINTYEEKYKTDPHKRDTDEDGYTDKEEVDKNTNPLDPDEYPKSNALFYMFLFIALILLGVAFFFGFKKFKEMRAGKIEIPPIKEEKPVGIKPITKEEKIPAKKPEITKKIMPPRLKEKLEKTMKKKREKRERMFDKFGFGGASIKKEAKPKEIRPKEIREEGSRTGWIELGVPKKYKETPKEKIPSIFERLPKTTAKLKTGAVFDILSKMVGAEVKQETVKEFTDLAERKKLTKEELLELINKFSKEKKLDEETLHKILLSVLEEKKEPIKKEIKEKLPTIVKKEARRKKITKIKKPSKKKKK